MADVSADQGGDARYKAAIEKFQSMEQDRRQYEDVWDRVAEYIFPRRHFELNYGTPRIRPRRLVDTTAQISNERLAALLFGYMMPPYRPWVRPTILSRDPTPAEAAWFEKRQKFMFNGLQSPRSNFTSAGHESLQDDAAFGNSVIWTGKIGSPGRPFHKAMPLRECYWFENANGVVDTLYRRYCMPLAQAISTHPTPKLQEKAKDASKSRDLIEFIHCVEPRENGVAGGFAARKPFKSLVICVTTREVASEGGFDTFPYAVTRLKKRPGENYGEGFGWDALPLAMVLNEMQETVMRAAELETDPPLVSMIGALPRLDRRPGGLTNLTAAQLRRLDDPDKVLKRLFDGGNVNISVELIRDIRRQIEFLYYIDWMSLPVGGNATATEIYERRDIRLRSMTPIVSRGESEKLTSIAERVYDLTQDDFEKPPETLNGEELGWEYFSPLAQAQQQASLETFDRAMGILDRAALHDPEIGDNVNLDTAAQEALVAAGVAIKDIRTPEQIRARRQQRMEAKQREQAIMEAQGAASAARDAGQAIGAMRQQAA